MAPVQRRRVALIWGWRNLSTPSLPPKQFPSGSTQPQAILGIKKRTKKICLPGQSHSDALDTGAREMGFRDYYQAQLVLSSDQGVRPRQYLIFLTAYSRDSDSIPRSAGCETLEVELSSPLTDIVSRHQGKYAWNLERFRQESSDHLELMSNQESQTRAWRE